MASQEPSMQLLAEAAQNQTPLSNIDDQDNRSSSLSDIDDNNESEIEAGSENELSLEASEEEEEEEVEEEDPDTEAETERLEESPDKLRKQKKVLLNADNESTNTNATPLKQASLPEPEDAEKDDAPSDILDATSPVSSPVDSGDEVTPPASPLSSSSRKRKRRPESSSATKRAAMQILKNAMGDDLDESKKNNAEFIVKTINGRQKIKGADLLNGSAGDSPTDNVLDGVEDANEAEEEVEGADSNEDVDMDDAAPEADSNVKSEGDLPIRKDAADKVTSVEEQFQLFRERLYGEAVAKINAELASLDRANSTHPEYLSICTAITRQSQDRIALARSRFSLQVRNWQSRGIAENAQYHSQYAQSCRDIRDSALTKATDEWYQIQKVRRTAEDSIAPISLSQYKKVDLIAQQTAYNTEVSLLSGIARYVGFPAAPDLNGATATEIEDDLRSLGTSLPLPQSHVSSSISQYLRQNLAAEKQFSMKTPWANAQHHVHGAAYSWSPARPNSPFTPANQSQQDDPSLVVGSASTIPGSHAVTPVGSGFKGSSSKTKAHSGNLGETPSRIPQIERPDSVSQQTNGYTVPRTKISAEGPMDGRHAATWSSPVAMSHELKMGST